MRGEGDHLEKFGRYQEKTCYALEKLVGKHDFFRGDSYLKGLVLRVGFRLGGFDELAHIIMLPA